MYMYKLLINNTNVFQGTLIKLIQVLPTVAKDGDSVEIYVQARVQWRLVDGVIWRVPVTE